MSGIAEKTLDSHECDKNLDFHSLFPNLNVISDTDVDNPIDELEIYENTGIEAWTTK